VRGRTATMAVGVAMIASVVSGRSALLVRPWFVPVLLVTGAVLVVAALTVHSRATPAAALLVVPIVVGATLSPDAVGRISQGRADAASLSARLGDRADPLLSGRGGPVTLLQIRVAEAEAGGVALAGRHVTVEALSGRGNTISRSVMVCCAADARTITLRVIGARLPASGWVRIDGALTTLGRELVLQARSVRRIPTPEEPFL
jgi:hypothetical protein